MSLLILAGCAGGPQPGPSDPADYAERLINQGQYQQAADQLLALAEKSRGERHNTLLLRAVSALARANNIPLARQLMARIKTDALNQEQFFSYKLAQANLSLSERKPDNVLSLLSSSPPENTSPYLQAEYHLLKAESYMMLGHRLESARERVKREAFLDNPEATLENQRTIWETLGSYSERALNQLRTNPPPDVLSGWMEIVQVAKAYQLEPEKLKTHIQNWRQKYPQHPILDETLANLLNRSQEDIQKPTNIALLLPLTSKYANAAEAIRDGFIAAYYNQHDAEQNIRIYDTVNEDESINTIYQQAIEEGADFIVGPLDKSAIKKLVSNSQLTKPTLALNYAVNDDVPGYLYQFGLSPEAEAQQVAERTWLDGYVNAVALVPSGTWGERVYQAFNERWQQLGGRVVEMQTYDAKKNDFSHPIQEIMNIDDSQRRYRSIQSLLNRKVMFTPRRREDVDFVFLAAYPRQGRQIRPQLKFFHAGDLPVYATSHIYTGSLNQERDRDMDGLIFGDMPWVLSESTTHRNMRIALDPYISKIGNQLQRLYALGIDAYNVIAALNTLKQHPYERFDGETGSLNLDGQQRIQRQLTWVKFRSGHPVLKDRSMQ